MTEKLGKQPGIRSKWSICYL